MGGNIENYNREQGIEVPRDKTKSVSYTPGKGPVLKDSHDKQETLKKCPDKYECMNLPKDIVDILKEDQSLKKAGFRFDKASGKLIFPEGFSNTEKIKKIRKFLEFSGWLYSDKADKLKESNLEQYKIEKFNKYIELTKLSTQIEGMNKKILQYRYINSIYQDIIDDGFVFQKDENGNYTLNNPKTGKEAKGPYAKMLLDSRNINSFDFDFAFLSSITNNSAIFNEKGLISQSHTISAILDKHKITDKSGRRITPTSIMLIDWKNIKTQIDEKIGNVKSTNLHSYQELMYLKGFIENKDYLNTIGNRALYKELNTYNTVEGQVNALMGAAKGETTEKGMMEKIMGVANDLAIPGIMLGILLSIFSGTRSVGKALLIGGIGGLVGAKVIKAVGSRVEGFSDDDLGLIVPQEIIYSPENKNKDYSKGIKKLQELNKENNSKSGYKENGEQLSSIDNNKTIIDITNDILSLDKDYKVLEDPTVLFAVLKAKNTSGNYDYEHVKSYLDLLTSEGFEKDEGDKTIRDYLSEGGLDIINKPYKSSSFTGVTEIDKKVNETLKAKWTKLDVTREERKSILKIQTTINSELSATKKAIDSVKTFFFNLWQKTGGDNKIEEYPDIDIQTRILDTISAVENIDPSIGAKIKPNLESYSTYIKLEEELAKYVGLIDGGYEANKAKLFGVLGIVSDSAKDEGIAELNIKVTEDIDKINDLIIKCGTKDELASIKEKAEEKLAKLKKVKQETNEKLGIKGENSSSTEIEKEIKSNSVSYFSKHISEINKSYRELKEINESEDSDIKLENVEAKLEKVGESYKILKEYDKAYKDISIDGISNLVKNSTVLIPFSDFNASDVVIKIKNRLSEYKTIKDSVKTKLEKPLKEFYKENADKITDLDGIKTSSKFEDDLKALAKAKEYLAENNIELTNEQEQVLVKLEETKQKAIEVLEKLKEKATEENKTAEEIKLIDKAIEVVKKDIPDFASKSYKNTKEFFNDVGDFFGNGLDEINSISFDLNTLKSTAIGLFDTSKEEVNKVISDSKDEQAEKAVKELREAFGDKNLFKNESKNHTLEKVKGKYDSMKGKVEGKAKEYLSNLTLSNNSEGLKNQAKKMIEIEKTLESYPTVLDLVKEKYKLIEEEYKKVTNISENKNIKNALNTDISLLPEGDVIKVVIESFDFSTTKISNIKEEIDIYVKAIINSMNEGGKSEAEIKTFVDNEVKNINDKLKGYYKVLDNKEKLFQ